MDSGLRHAMFTLSYKFDSEANLWFFTLVRPDTTFASGERHTLDKIFEFVKQEHINWEKRFR